MKAYNQFMQAAVEEALDGIRKGHGGPSGSVVVKDGDYLQEMDRDACPELFDTYMAQQHRNY